MTAPLLKILQRAATADAGGAAPDAPRARLVLPFEIRSRSRFRARLEDGEEGGVMLPRGQILRGGDRLLAEDGRIVEIHAAREPVTTARARDAGSLARGAYHLGNRHVPLELGAHWLRYGRDHVLDAMLAGMGFELTAEEQPFEPEAGAYHGHRHAGEHDPGLAHGPDHAHDPGLAHGPDHAHHADDHHGHESSREP